MEGRKFVLLREHGDNSVIPKHQERHTYACCLDESIIVVMVISHGSRPTVVVCLKKDLFPKEIETSL